MLSILTLLSMSPAVAADAPTDARIADAVDLELLVQEGTRAWPIEVDVSDGIVTLQGTVPSLLEKDRAEGITERVRGVRSVVNRIEVEPPVRPDPQIEDDVRARLRSNPVTESWELGVDTDAGIVTLTGMVESWQEKDLAERAAKAVSGVVAVENRIEWTIPGDRPGRELKEEIEEAIDWNVYLANALVDVKVKNGKVKLSGTVGSAAERDLLERLAWAQGVHDVNIRKVDVEPWARNDQLRPNPIAHPGDGEIRQAVLDAWAYDPRVFSYQPEVRVDDGLVTLTGEVATVEARLAAEADARNTVGVVAVSNLLRVVPVTPPGDAQLERDLERSLAMDPYLQPDEVEVDVERGIARLTGSVDTAWERGHAAAIASWEDGVVLVDNQLEVSDAVWTRAAWGESHVDLVGKTDAELVSDVEAQLFWSPFVEADEISVTADDGIVTLMGTADSFFEKRKASENAREGGALAVDNDLVVELDTDDRTGRR